MVSLERIFVSTYVQLKLSNKTFCLLKRRSSEGSVDRIEGGRDKLMYST